MARIIIDPNVCNGCNICYDVCPHDVFAPNEEKGKPPKVVRPDECGLGGTCLMDCPLYDKGAIKVIIPFWLRPHFLRVKE